MSQNVAKKWFMLMKQFDIIKKSDRGQTPCHKKRAKHDEGLSPVTKIEKGVCPLSLFMEKL